MRINRQKKVNKCLNFYVNNFGFRKPYQLLIDGTFCHTALNDKINIQDQLPKYLNGAVKLLTTPCAVLETEKLGPAVYGAMLILKQFPVHSCGHKKPIAASRCFLTMLANKNPKRYFIATQDRNLQTKVRQVLATPLLYIYNNAPVLEEPSAFTISVAKKNVEKNTWLSPNEAKTLKKIKKSVLGPQEPKIVRKKKKIKGPNPLSCKKKKKKQ